jgi:hypothetical protein
MRLEICEISVDPSASLRTVSAALVNINRDSWAVEKSGCFYIDADEHTRSTITASGHVAIIR